MMKRLRTSQEVAGSKVRPGGATVGWGHSCMVRRHWQRAFARQDRRGHWTCSQLQCNSSHSFQIQQRTTSLHSKRGTAKTHFLPVGCDGHKPQPLGPCHADSCCYGCSEPGSFLEGRSPDANEAWQAYFLRIPFI